MRSARMECSGARSIVGLRNADVHSTVGVDHSTAASLEFVAVLLNEQGPHPRALCFAAFDIALLMRGDDRIEYLADGALLGFWQGFDQLYLRLPAGFPA